MNPLVPLRIARRIRLLVLGLEHAHHLPVHIPRKVAPRAALRDHPWMHALADSRSNTLHNDLKLSLGHVPRLRDGQHLSSHRPDAFGRLKNRVMNLQPLLIPLLLIPATLKLGGDLVSPALEPGIDGFEIDARVAPPSVSATGTLERGG